MRILLLLFLIISVIVTRAKEYSLDGIVKDNETLKPISQSTILVSFNNLEITTDTNGYFSLQIPETDSLTVIISHPRYTTQSIKMNIENNTVVEIRLSPDLTKLDKLFATGQRNNIDIQKPQMGMVKITPESIKKMPVILGESDVMKAVQLLPGVQFGHEGTADIFVRGGNGCLWICSIF